MVAFNKEALKGLNVCVTGAISAVGTRANVDRLIQAAGGTPHSSVSANTNLLVTGYKPGATKVTAAGRYGVKIITKDEFMEMLGGESTPEKQVEAQPKIKEPTPEHYGDW